MKTVPFLAAFVCAFSFIESDPLFAQGALTPPPGPPAPTMKTLDQPEPRKPISQPAAGVNAADINGANSGSSDGFSGVDPWANFSY